MSKLLVLKISIRDHPINEVPVEKCALTGNNLICPIKFIYLIYLKGAQ